ncbi:PREDICTED: leucine-rich repeat-containing protein 73-like, partial [Priapulus caudatus]|uniref:Leucine-rich repeat-containing protein 73-like n=1 Tax=Priapulus caudatus TaxID=37621 RepID=A0ABM1F771_PRICU
MMIASIQVVGSTLTSSELDEILQALSQNTLRFLCLQDCALEEREFKDLCRAIEEGTSLEHLSLSGAMLQDTDRVSVLTSALRRNASITNLSLNDNALKDAGVLSVVESLELHPQLSCLNLSECQIGDDGIKAISRLLPPCKARP